MEQIEQQEIKEEVYDIGEYRIFFPGLAPRTSDERKRELVQLTADLLQLTAFKANELIEAKNVVVKSNLDPEIAEDLAKQLNMIGLEVVVLGMDEPLPSQKKAAAATAAPPPAPAAAPHITGAEPVTLTCLSCNKVRNRVKAPELLPKATCSVCGELVAPPDKFPAIVDCRTPGCHTKNRVKRQDLLPLAKCAKCGKRLTA